MRETRYVPDHHESKDHTCSGRSVPAPGRAIFCESVSNMCNNPLVNGLSYTRVAGMRERGERDGDPLFGL